MLITLCLKFSQLGKPLWVGIGLIVWRGHDRNIPIPFGPYLAGAGFVATLWGGDLMQWYLG